MRISVMKPNDITPKSGLLYSSVKGMVLALRYEKVQEISCRGLGVCPSNITCSVLVIG